MKIISTDWATHGVGTIGIIVTENEIGERKIRIGIGAGYSEAEDARTIAESGGRISVDSLRQIIKTAEENQ